MFIIYLNDTENVIQTCEIVSCADDTLIFYNVHRLESNKLNFMQKIVIEEAPELLEKRSPVGWEMQIILDNSKRIQVQC